MSKIENEVLGLTIFASGKAANTNTHTHTPQPTALRSTCAHSGLHVTDEVATIVICRLQAYTCAGGHVTSDFSCDFPRGELVVAPMPKQQAIPRSLLFYKSEPKLVNHMLLRNGHDIAKMCWKQVIV
jgi:hypothetical protein